MTVTVPAIRNAAAMDVDVSVWIQLQVLYYIIIYYGAFKFLNLIVWLIWTAWIFQGVQLFLGILSSSNQVLTAICPYHFAKRF